MGDYPAFNTFSTLVEATNQHANSVPSPAQESENTPEGGKKMNAAQ